MYGNILGGHFLFSGFSQKEIGEIASQAVVRSFGAGETVFFQGDAGNGLYCILEGGVKVMIASENGKELVLAVLEKGGFFGEMSLFDGKIRSASVVASMPSQLLFISRELFVRQLGVYPELALKLLAVMGERLRQANGYMEFLVFAPLRERLLKILYSFVQENCGLVRRIPYTHRELAEFLGVSRESVSRIFSDLKKEGIVSGDGKSVCFEALRSSVGAGAFEERR